MLRTKLIREIFDKKSMLCVGLDTDIEKLPPHLPATPEGMWLFNRAIIQATSPYCVAYKINTAFYEAHGAEGWQLMAQTFNEIPDTHLKIADAKRGDIGNTGEQYAKAFFDHLQADAITVAPYMGRDSLQPFLDRKDKFTIVLGLTSNEGSRDFQLLETEQGQLFEVVIQKSMEWGSSDQLMLVVGATRSDTIRDIRKLAPDLFFLVPGVGAQGGDLEAIIREGHNVSGGLLINASRSIIFASKGNDFADAAAGEAKKLQTQMALLMDEIFE